MFYRVIAAALVLTAGALGAQTATVSGTVHDSIGHRALDGAVVQIAKGEFAKSATSDSTGRFLIADIPPGSYTLGFFHPILDSIGIEAPTRTVQITDGRGVITDLAVPSPARMRAAICGPGQARDSAALIIGTVRDAVTDRVAEGVTVTGEWFEYVINRGGMKRQLRRLSATTGENGWFALCNVPGSGTVALTAARGRDSTGVIEMQIPPEQFARRELYIGSIETEPVAVSSAASDSTTRDAPRVIHVGKGRLTGKVLAVEGNRPLANAIVAIVDGPSARTNSDGEFTLTRAPTGTQMFEVRAVGYYPHRRHIDVLPSSQPVTVSLSTLKAVLDTVRIYAKLSKGPDDGGFLRRMKQSFGHFMTPQDVAKWNPFSTSDLFRYFAGVRTLKDGLGEPVILVRSNFGGWCKPSIFIDGANVSFMDASDLDTWVKPQQIAGLEVYSGTMVPAEFQQGMSGCGSIVVWTR